MREGGREREPEMAVKRVEEEKEKQGRYSSTFSDSCSRHFF